MSSMRLITAEMHAVQCSNEAAWAHARAALAFERAAAARGVRRLLHFGAALALQRQARVHEREMGVWEAELHAEVRAEEFRFVDQDQHA